MIRRLKYLLIVILFVLTLIPAEVFAEGLPEVWTITLHGEGATEQGVKSVTVVKGDTIEKLKTIPSKEGGHTVKFNYNGNGQPISTYKTYEFEGYFTKDGKRYYYADGTPAIKKWNDSSVTELYAHWTGESVTLPTPNEWSGHEFQGWYDNKSEETHNRIGSAGASYTPTKTVALYAHWNAEVTTDYGEQKEKDRVIYLRVGGDISNYGDNYNAFKSAMETFLNGISITEGQSVEGQRTKAANRAREYIETKNCLKDNESISYIYSKSDYARYCDNKNNEFFFEVGIKTSAPDDEVHLKVNWPSAGPYIVGPRIEVSGTNCVDFKENYGTYEKTSHRVKVEFVDFTVDNKSSVELGEGNVTKWEEGEKISAESWTTSGNITSITKGATKGKIVVSCNCNKSCKEEFEINFAKPSDTHLTAELLTGERYVEGDMLQLRGFNCVDFEEKEDGSFKITSHKVNIKFEKFMVDNKDGLVLLADKEWDWNLLPLNAEFWGINREVTWIDKDATEGKIIVSCDCNKKNDDGTKGCKKEFTVKFKPGPNEVHLIAELTSSGPYALESTLSLSGSNCVDYIEESEGNYKITSHKVKVEFKNFTVDSKSSMELLKDKSWTWKNGEKISAESWTTSGKITSITKDATQGEIIVSCNCNGHCEKTFTIDFSDPDPNPDPDPIPPSGEPGDPNTVCNYEDKSEHQESEEKHLTAEFHSTRNNGTGKDTLYMLGDAIWLNGTDCFHVIHEWRECTSETYTYWVDEGTYVDDGNGGEVWLANWVQKKEPLPGCGGHEPGKDKWNVTYYPVTVTLKGFTLNNRSQFNFAEIEGEQPFNSKSFGAKSWTTDYGMLITSISNDYYDASCGTHYGIIEVSCPCCKGGHTKDFYVYFGGDSGTPQPKLKVTINPQNSGSAQVKGLFWENNVWVERSYTVEDSKEFVVLPGTMYNIYSTANGGWDYYNIEKDGKQITDDLDYYFRMPYEPSGIIELKVNFQRNYKNYTLYVTSNEGGKAWTDDRPSGTTYEQYKEKGKVLGDKLSNVKPNTEFQLKEEESEGYEFSRYEYRPYVKENSSGNFYMPHSDLTATGIFKKDKIEQTNNPKLTVISNNPAWGTAYAELNGSQLANPAEITKDTNCTIKFKSNPGYYFTNWEYDSAESPFSPYINSENVIQMPGYDLKIIAFFAPIPAIEEYSGKDVSFVAEAIDANDKIISGVVPGIVPEKLIKIKDNEKVTFGVTANKGYNFIKWYFTDENGTEIDTSANWTEYGSGCFVMPNKNVVAHAVFRKTVVLTITIKGIGNVYLGNESVINGYKKTLVQGSSVNLKAEALGDYRFGFWQFSIEEGNKTDKEIKNYVVNENIIITANFVLKENHTLYITYCDGGTAEPTVYPNDKTVEDFIVKGKKVGCMIKNLKDGEKVTIRYATTDGWQFKEWTYMPYIIEKVEVNNTTQITMPDSDLTVTAGFKYIDGNPKLMISSNNPEWGTAHVKDNDGNETVDRKWNLKVTPGGNYRIILQPSSGYRLVKYTYSTSNTPFIDKDIIQMPNGILEVIAHFEEDKIEENGHSVTFKAYLEEGGRVPDNLTSVAPGSNVTLGVTPNIGWKFIGWEFKDASGNIINSKLERYWDQNGTGYFKMPDYNIIATAKFIKVTTYKLSLTYGEGGTAWLCDMHGNKVLDGAGTIEVMSGRQYYVCYKVSDKNNYEFKDIESSYGNLKFTKSGDNYEGSKYFEMPASDLTLHVEFNEKTIPSESAYTLYVVYNAEGGWAQPSLWAVYGYKLTDYNYEGKKIGYKVENVKEGTMFTIEKNPYFGYRAEPLQYSSDVETNGNWIKMPAEDLTVYVHFTHTTPQTGPKLRIISNNPEWGSAYTSDDNGNKTTLGVWNEYVTVGQQYKLTAQATDGYFLSDWGWVEEDIYSTNRRKISWNQIATTPFKFDDPNTIEMPNRNLTIIAIFSPRETPSPYKIKVVSNNYLWGDAYLVVGEDTDNPISWKISNDNPQASEAEGIPIESGKTYTVYFKPRTGYHYEKIDPSTLFDDPRNVYRINYSSNIEQEYLAWQLQEYLAWQLNEFVTKGGGLSVKMPKKPNSDINITVYFNYDVAKKNLYVEASPDIVKNVKNIVGIEVNNSNYGYPYDYPYEYQTVTRVSKNPGEDFKVFADKEVTATIQQKNEDGEYENVKSTWSFSHWNMVENGTIFEEISSENTYTGQMGNADIKMVAVYKMVEKPTGGGGDSTKCYDLHVIIKGNGKVVDENGQIVTVRRLKNWSKITLTAIPDTGSTFDHWTVENRNYYSTSKEFKISGKDLYVTVYFPDIIPGTEEARTDRFKIISVRDLRWKDYFVDKKGNSTGLTYSTPLSNSVMLPKPKDASKDINEVKMGYAVEFEHTTYNVASNNAKLVITPIILQDGKPKPISLDEVYDYTSGVKQSLAEYFKKVVINGNNSDAIEKINKENINYKTKYQTVATPIPEYNNGILVNKIKWNWLYYLPANIWFEGATKDPITIRFDINLYEGDKLMENLVQFEKTYNHSSWKGDVYKYSMQESLLDDIYNNATN